MTHFLARILRHFSDRLKRQMRPIDSDLIYELREGSNRAEARERRWYPSGRTWENSTDG